MRPMPTLRDARNTALTIFAGTAGAFLFNFLHFPAAWLTGSMIAVSALVLAKAPFAVPEGLRQPVFLLLGVSIGSGFDPNFIAGLTKWPLSLAILAITVAAVIAASAAFLAVKGQWSRPTALFASIPGALSYVLVMSMRSTADTRLVVMAQMLRLTALLIILPFIVSVSVEPSALPASQASGYLGVFSEILAGGIAGYILERLKFPAGMLFGGMIAGAAFHLTGTVAGQMPPAIFIPCQIIMGCFIGLRFAGTELRLLKKALLPSIGAFLIALAISGAAAVLVAWSLHVPLGQVIVAFAPGGLEAMVILAFVLDVDPAFVAAHQLARFLGLALLLPLITKLYLPAERIKA
jgi:membrane AbrB-like protein